MDQQALAQLLGNYGEFLGSIAVVLTLIYVAIQIRQTKSQIEKQIEQNGYIQYSNALALMVSEHGSKVLVKGLESMSTLTNEEEVQFYAIVTAGLNTVEHQYRLLEERDSSYEETMWNIASIYLARPGGKEYWLKYRNVYFVDFAAWVDSQLEKANNSSPSDAR